MKSPGMAVSRKRLFDEYETLESVNKPTKTAKLHGVICNLSPMKAGKYFEGELARRDTAAMRIVGFNTKLQQELSEQVQEGPVTLENCTVQKSKYSDSYEVLLNNSTKIGNSPKKFEHVKSRSRSYYLTLKELDGLQMNQRVTVTAKILRAGDKEEVKANLFNRARDSSLLLYNTLTSVSATKFQPGYGIYKNAWNCK